MSTAPAWARTLLDWLRRTARSVGDIALGLNAAERAARQRHDELKGILLAALTQTPPKAPPSTLAAGGSVERGREGSRRFDLPGGGSVEIPDKTAAALFWKLIKIGAAIVFAGGGWIWHLLRALGHH